MKKIILGSLAIGLLLSGLISTASIFLILLGVVVKFNVLTSVRPSKFHDLLSPERGAVLQMLSPTVD